MLCAQSANITPPYDAVLMNTLGTVPLRIGNPWRASCKMGRHHQYVVTFVKGDPKRATSHLGKAA
ncbi:hypothetical protein AB0D04_08075 [Streptomyces sp. NPDC048483]|uniref:hypothetical protein n=1 Tax=Streptomyces sp. NPDC048483 TaxID=3154927 RepID=UPI00341E58EE